MKDPKQPALCANCGKQIEGAPYMGALVKLGEASWVNHKTCSPSCQKSSLESAMQFSQPTGEQ